MVGHRKPIESVSTRCLCFGVSSASEGQGEVDKDAWAKEQLKRHNVRDGLIGILCVQETCGTFSGHPANNFMATKSSMPMIRIDEPDKTAGTVRENAAGSMPQMPRMTSTRLWCKSSTAITPSSGSESSPLRSVAAEPSPRTAESNSSSVVATGSARSRHQRPNSRGPRQRTLGYDPQKKRFVGTFIAAAMTHLWPYNGSLDAAGQVLKLDSEGPSVTGDGMVKYQDIIKFHSDDYRTLWSHFLGAGGKWVPFMKAHYRRKR